MPAGTVSQAVAKQETPAAILAAQEREQRFASVLPDHINTKQFLGLAAGALYRDEVLLQAANNSPRAYVNALMRCAALGHQPGTDEFYLIPRRPKSGEKPVIQGLEG